VRDSPAGRGWRHHAAERRKPPRRTPDERTHRSQQHQAIAESTSRFTTSAPYEEGARTYRLRRACRGSAASRAIAPYAQRTPPPATRDARIAQLLFPARPTSAIHVGRLRRA
jgi:hypothetical protein